MRVGIPFLPQFHDVMLNGTKTMTSRTRKYGEKGDTFPAFEQVFEIVNVFQLRLDVVAWLHSREEGAKDPQDFMKVWALIHPRKGYVPEQEVWVHEFVRKEGTKT